MAGLRLAAFGLLFSAWAGSRAPLAQLDAASAACPPCAPAQCPELPARGCPLGQVLDGCGCCPQCARGEGEACGGGAGGWGRCAAGLECRRRRKGLPGSCFCKSRYPVCGSDGLTYPSACQLRAASLRAQSRGERPVQQRSKGPCEQGPSIVTPPKDIWNVTGAQIYLSCEVIGVPTPVLTWNKIVKGQRTELLPGDRENLAIQTRGGPEKHEVTGWVLISPLNKDDSGEYECHASNSQGEATASARITVVNSLQEIPTVKGGEAEL
ncbi:insulin-like growth factor-binding protein 7 [Heteronotia binoei]|uniref:insulin-like growth factor-binding protein 7 n=1 Tax=Heteronotia binoei TaxID=13085 RepID=UPI002931773F|nr:insulin-like growth factor-binding protein 7 [Heteronotia binoei]